MIYHPRTPQEAVNLRKEHADTAVYLAGGTDDLRLGGAAEGKNFVLVNHHNPAIQDFSVKAGELVTVTVQTKAAN